MRRSLLVIFMCVVPLFGAVATYSHYLLGLQNDASTISPTRRSLKSGVGNGKGSDTALVATLNGTIYLLDVGSMIPLWSFSSGPHIYSSYQAPFDDKENMLAAESNYFIDCGDDWELYAHNSLGKLKLMKSLEEYIISTPQIGEDGGVVHGYKKITTFLVDIKTGKVIRTYGKIDVEDLSYNMTGHDDYCSRYEMEKDELPLYITRTDYILRSFSSNSDKVLWNLSVAEIGAAFLCQGFDDTTVFEIAGIGSSKPGSTYKMPLPCQSRALVYRFRNHDLLEALSLPTGSSISFHEDRMLPASNANALPTQPNAGKVVEILSLPGIRTKQLDTHENMDLNGVFQNETSGEDNFPDMKRLSIDDSRAYFGSSFLVLFLVLVLLLFVVYHNKVVSRLKYKSLSESTGVTATSAPAKRKKPRKARNVGHTGGTKEEENEIRPTDAFSSEGRTIGKLLVSNKEIGKGSNGTIVFEGAYEGRPIAVKRLVRGYTDIAFKEIQNLIVSDCHPNIVTWFGVEQDQDFVYLALERCACSLNDLVILNSPIHPKSRKNMVSEIDEQANTNTPRLELWDQSGYPLPLLFNLMRDVVSGVAHLHKLGIIHRDLKPQNVLIVTEVSVCAKLSDMGISTRLVGETSSLSYHATGCGSSGWQAPEQLLQGRQTRAIDLFSLGCVLFFCITGGSHPFGNAVERDVNIIKGAVDLFLVQHIPEAMDIISQLLNPCSDKRPRALEVAHHPLFWNAETRLSFLHDTSDRVELECRGSGSDSDLLKSLESVGSVAHGGKWSDRMEASVLDNIGQYRRYKFDSVRDLLRVIRNKWNHYQDLPPEVQEILGAVPEGFDRYFRSRFPNLLIQVYKVMSFHVKEEQFFRKYLLCSSQ